MELTKQFKDLVVFNLLGFLEDSDCKEQDAYNTAIEQAVNVVKDTFDEIGKCEMCKKMAFLKSDNLCKSCFDKLPT